MAIVATKTRAAHSTMIRIKTQTIPVINIGHVEQPQQASLMLGDMRYTYQEVWDYCANRRVPPKPSVVSRPPSPDHPDLEPFPRYVDPFAVSLTLGEYAYYDPARIRHFYEQHKGQQVTLPLESSDESPSPLPPRPRVRRLTYDSEATDWLFDSEVMDQLSDMDESIWGRLDLEATDEPTRRQTADSSSSASGQEDTSSQSSTVPIPGDFSMDE
ncbi:hypothetical protein F5B21DRAFT_433080 [Xylaria acuta]|nr:hypothetical protein F5B21DRAFT_433080 [Xylaria acuta]